MPVILAILAAIGGAIWWWVRNNPREAIDTAADLITTAANAPRRLKFRRQTNAHPVEGVDDPRIAICAIAQSFIELDGLPTAEQRKRLNLLLRSKLRSTPEEAEEMDALGRWLMTQCGGPTEAVTRLGRRLYKLDSERGYGHLEHILPELVQERPSDKQVEAIDTLKRIFKV